MSTALETTPTALALRVPDPSPGSRRALSAILVAMILLGLAWELWLAPTGGRTWALKVLPLALALPGAWRGRLYTARWLSLLVWLYFTEGVVRWTGDPMPSALLAALQTGLSLALFAVCGLQVRSALRAARAAAQAAPASGG